jgi:dihydropyrimidinase
MKYETLISGGKVVIPGGGIQDVDIAIANGKVAALVARNSEVQSKTTINASGNYILPGVIDPHVHWGHSGSAVAEMPAESRAAAIGGCTTVIDYAVGTNFHDRKLTVVRPAESQEPLNIEKAVSVSDDFGFSERKANIEKLSHIDVALHFKMTDEARIALLDTIIRHWGISSFKFLMAYKNRPGYANEFKDGWFYEALSTLSGYGRAIACIHAENDEVVEYHTNKVWKAGEQGLSAWAKSRPDFAEAEAANRVLYFGKLTGCPIYIVHMSAGRALEEFSRYKQEGNNVYAETCPHYLLQDIDSPIGILGKIQPPLRTRADCNALWEGVADGRIDTIGTDSCATRLATKRGQGDIWTATSSFPGTATILPLMISEGFHKRGITLERIVELTSYNVAKIFNLYPQKGTIMVGSDADFAIVDVNLEQTVTPSLIQGFCDYNIFEGWQLKGWPVMTLLRGELIAKNGKLISDESHGRYLESNRFIP